MAATLVIFLREGVEASLIVSILLAYLDRIGQRRYFRDVFAGVAAAMLLAAGGGAAAYYTIRTYSGSRVQTIFETATYLLAAVVLTYMTFWMRSHARSLSGELRRRAEAALGGRQRFGLALLAFQAVGREGVETAVFTLAIVFATGAHGTLWGALAGLALAGCVAVAVYKLGRRVRLGAFFSAIGALLMVFAAGLVADTVENLQQLGWVRLGATPLWNTSGALSESSSMGDVVHSILGYADRPTALQVAVYGLYLAVALTAFLVLGHGARGASGTAQAREPTGGRSNPGGRAGNAGAGRGITGSAAGGPPGEARAVATTAADRPRRRRTSGL